MRRGQLDRTERARCGGALRRKLRSGPDAAGPLRRCDCGSLSRETRRAPGGGPACSTSGDSSLGLELPIPGRALLCRGLTAIILRRSEFSDGGATARRPLSRRSVVDDAAFHAAGDGHDLAGDVARSSSEASTTTARATSSGCATFRSAIVRVSALEGLRVERAARHRRVRPAGRDGVHARRAARCARSRS